ncbi:MAG: radical SAM/SPASM domain-containing protein [Desulfurivibrionaceae bacterium]
MKKFKKIYIEITNRCNLACSFCLPSRRSPAFMQSASFAEILDRINGYTDYISLHVLGEALLHPDLEHFLAMSREYGLGVNLSTNGVLLARKQAMLLRQPALRQINISLHSFEQSGSESVLDAYLSDIFAFMALAVPASPLFINLRMWNQNPEVIPAEWDLNRLIRERLARHFNLPAPIPEDFATGRGFALARQVFLSRENRFAWPHHPAPDLGGNGYCRGLRDHIAILVDGTVAPCCLDAEADMPLGNILQKTLPEILAGSRAAMIREGFARQQILEPVCRRCTYRQRFHKERGKAGVTALLAGDAQAGEKKKSKQVCF